MTTDQAIEAARAVLGDEVATLTIHRGRGRDIAVRFSGCADVAALDRHEGALNGALPGGKYVRNGDFVAVWFDGEVNGTND